jgi:hypothetical protein
VTTEELDVALEELEVRLERLRALYEQYFLGFEKIEPSVARKDVDRRIYLLRREKIRNTGKRFKLQTIIQRYNTFQQYWQRICREIENGTYRRHVLRAEKQLSPNAQLTIAARRRFGKLVAAGDSARPSSAPSPSEFPAEEVATRDVPRRDTPPPDSGDLATRRPPPPSAPVEKAAPVPKPSRLPRVSSRPPVPTDKLELDMGFLGSWAPGAPNAPATPQETSAGTRAAPPPKPSAAKPAGAALAPLANARTAPNAVPPKRRSSPEAAPPPKAGPPPKPAARPAETAQAAGVSDDRLRDLHQKLAHLKKENRETGQVSLESLTKTVRETEAKLRAQHKDRKIDFEVVLRDGKAIVKPTVR